PHARENQHNDEYQADDQAQGVGFGHAGSAPAVQPFDAVGWGDDVGDADAVLVFHGDDFALGNQIAVDVDVHGFAGQPVEFDHRPLPELQDVLDGQPGAPQFDRQLNGDVHDHVDVAVAFDGAVHQRAEQMRCRAGGGWLRGRGGRSPHAGGG